MGMGIAAGLGAGALWGTLFLLPLILPTLSAIDLSAGRFVSYGLFSLALLILSGQYRRRPNVKQLVAVSCFGVLGFTLNFAFFAMAIQNMGVAIPAFLSGTTPIWLMLLGKPATLPWKRLFPGLLVTAVGLCVMAGAGQPAGSAHAPQPQHFWLGLLQSLVATASWVVYSLWNAKFLKGNPDISGPLLTHWTGIAAGLSSVLAWCLLGSDLQHLEQSGVLPMALGVSLATGIGTAWLSSILWNMASQRLSQSLCGQLIVSETLFALLFAHLWMGSYPTVAEVAAVALLLLGITITIKAHT